MRQISKSFWLTLLLTVFMTASAAAAVVKKGNYTDVSKIVTIPAAEELTTAGVTATGDVIIAVTPTTDYYVAELKVVQLVNASEAQARRAPGFADDVKVTEIVPDNTQLTAAGLTGADAYYTSGVRFYKFTMPDNGRSVEVSAKALARTDFPIADLELDPTVFTYNTQRQVPVVKKVATPATLQTVDRDGTAWVAVFPPESTNATAIDGTPFTGVDPYKVTIYGIGKYKGTFDNHLTYNINAKTITPEMVTLSEHSFIYNGQNQKPATVTVYFDPQNQTGTDKVVAATEYTLTNDGGTNVGTYDVVVTGKATPAVQANYTGTATRHFTINKFDISKLTWEINPHDLVRDADDAESEYNATAHVITYDERSHKYSVKAPVIPTGVDLTAIDATDYEVTWPGTTDFINTGNIPVQVTAVGANFTGVVDLSYAIIEKGIEPFEGNITLTEGGVAVDNTTYTYDNTAKEPVVAVVNHNGVTMATDQYTVEYKNNINAGTATVIVSGKGHYSGKITKTFVINPRAIDHTDVTAAAIPSIQYTGKSLRPIPVLTAYGYTLNMENAGDHGDFSVVWANNINAYDTPVVTITGHGNFTGTRELTFDITPKPLSDEMVQFDKDYFIYNRAQQNPVVTVTDNETLDDGTTSAMVVSTASAPGTAESTDVKITIPASVNAKNAGIETYTVTVVAQTTGNFNYIGTITKTYGIDAKDIATIDAAWEIEPTDVLRAETDGLYDDATRSIAYDQQTHKYDVVENTYLTVALAEGTDYTRTWDTTDFTNPGVKGIHLEGTNNFKGQVDLSYSIVEKGIAEFTVTLFTDDTQATAVNAATYTYNMAEHKPYVKVVNHENQTLNLNEHYKVQYKNNVNAGTATVIISGEGHYSGSIVTTEFTINPKNISLDTETINPSADAAVIDYTDPAAKTYNGQAQTDKPAISYTVGGNNENLILGYDFTVDAWQKNTNASANDGDATATVTGIGNYTGERTLTMVINQKQLNEKMIKFTDNADYFVYNRAQQNPEVTVADYDAALRSTVAAANTAITQAFTADNDVNITVPASVDAQNSEAKIYTVTVTALDNGNYTGTVTRDYKIDAKDVNELTWKIWPEDIEAGGGKEAAFNEATKSIKYDQNQHKYSTNNTATGYATEWPAGTQMTVTTEYTLTYPSADYTNPGVKEIVITGKGNFKGETTLAYSIVEQELEDIAAANIVMPTATYTYDMSEQKPEPTITNNAGETLVKDTHYYLEYKNNVNAGEATVIISGTGHYSGQLERTFTIAPRDVNDAVITYADPAAVVYNGVAQEAQPTTFNANYGTLSEDLVLDKDFTIGAWNNNTNATEVDGNATATITGIGNYTGTRTLTLDIDQKELTLDMLHLDKDFFTFNNKVQEPVITVSDDEGDNFLIETRDIESKVITNSSNEVTTGTSTAEDEYTVTITAKADGNYKDPATKVAKKFWIGEKNIDNADVVTVTLTNGTEYVYTGQAIEPAFTITQLNAAGVAETMPTDEYTYEYVDNIDVSYKGDAVVAGAALVIKGAGKNYDARSKVVVPFTITRRDISDPALVTFGGLVEKTFTGDPIEQDIVLTNTATGAQLTEDGDKADYMVEYSNNVKATTTPATVVITGQGNYTGTITETFVINAKDLAGNVRIQNIEDQVYNGSEITPALVVTDIASGRKLAENTDYVVVYSDNINVGTATVQLTGAGNYTGTEEKTFQIVPRDIKELTITLDPDRIKYTGEVVTTEIASVIDEGIDATVELKDGFAIVGYDCTPGCIEKGTHFAYVEQVNNPNYTGRAEVPFTIYDKDFNDPAFAFDLKLEETLFVYDGTRKEPKVTLIDKSEGNDRLLVEGTDYTLSYQDNYGATVKKAGERETVAATTGNADRDAYALYTDETVNLDDPADTYRNIPTVVITGKGGFVGTIKAEFYIAPRTLMFAHVDEPLAHVEYNGFAQNPQAKDFIVKDINGNQLIEGYDFTFEPATSINAGEATTTIRGRHNYDIETTLEGKFIIDKKPLTEEMLSFDKYYFVYNGEAQHPVVTVADGDPTVLFMDKDVIITMPENNKDEAKRKDPVEVGTYTIEVEATEEGNYSGWIAKDYKIGTKSVNNVQIAAIADQTFTGEAIEPELTVTLTNENGTALTLVKDEDYTVTYKNNVNAGEATAQIVGKGNYDLETFAEQTFTILPKSIENAAVAGIVDVIYNGAAQEQNFTVTDEDRNVVLTENDDYTVAYENNEVAGTAKVTITGKGNYTDAIEKTFTIEAKTLNVNFADIADVVYNREEQKVAPVVTDADTKKQLEADVDYTVAYSADVTNVGEVTITITGKTNFQGTAEKTYNIVAKNIADFDVTLTPDAYEYDATAKEPVATVKDGDYTLAADEYTVTYANNTNAGTATAIITGQGNYTGTVEKAFNIGGKSIENFDIVLGTYDAVYNGQAKTPAVTMKNQANQTMTENTDFTVDYKDNVNAGTATVTVIGKGFYHGSVSKTFQIDPRSIDLAAIAPIASQQFTGSELTPAVVVSDLNTVLVEGTDFTVAYAQNVNVADAPVVTLTGMGNYTATKTLNSAFAITPKAITASMIALSQENFVYNRANQKPVVTVTDDENGIDLVAAGYATVTNDGGVEVGQYEVKVVASGNYSGTQTKQFSIVSENAKVFDVALAYTTAEYTGSALQPAVTVKDGAATLATANYTVKYENNVNVGKAVVTVTGQNGYEGTVTKTFDITPRSAQNMTIAAIADQTYTGNVIEPAFNVTDGTKTLVKGVDYTFFYNNNLNVGRASLTIQGKGNYNNEKVVNFNVVAKNVAELTVAAIAQRTYTGQEQTPAVVVSYNGKQLVAGQDFDVTYTDNVNVGTAIASISGKGNYTGINGVPFMITPKALNAGMLERYETMFTYNGENQKPVVKVIDRERNVQLGADQVTITNAGGTEIGNYEFTVEAKAGGNYAGTLEGQYSIVDRNAANFDVVLEYAHHVFTGEALQPQVTVTDAGNAQLTDNSGFTVVYDNNVNAGKASVKVTGTGNYRGEVTKFFDITPKDIAELAVAGIENVIYNGEAYTPEVTVTYGDNTLVLDTDYTVTYANNTNAGTATVTLKGWGNYTGETTKNFVIAQKNIAADMVVVAPETVVYNGELQKPVVTVTDAERNVVLTEGVDYTLTNDGGENVGSYAVMVVGCGNYTAAPAVLKTFTITPAEIAVVNVAEIEQPVTGELLDVDAVFEAEGVDAISAVNWTPAAADGVAEGETVYTASVELTNNSNYVFADNVVAYVNGEAATATVAADGKLTVSYEFETTLKVVIIDNTFVVNVTDPQNKTVVIDNTVPNNQTVVYIPATVEIDGVNYDVTEVAEDAFKNWTALTDVYMPETDEPLTIGEGAFDNGTVVTIHTPLSLLDDYALAPALEDNFEAGKIEAPMTFSSRLVTFSCGVDVQVPEGVVAHYVKAKNDNAVTLVDLEAADLYVGGVAAVKANNGVIFSGVKGQTYTIVAHAGRQIPGTPVATGDAEDYADNLLEPVIEAKSYDADKYYVLYQDEFRVIADESKVPANRAVLRKPSVNSAARLIIDVDIQDSIENIEAIFGGTESKWYDLQGNRINRPSAKGIYILNGHKVAIK